jgi:hypothetical protein
MRRTQPRKPYLNDNDNNSDTPHSLSIPQIQTDSKHNYKPTEDDETETADQKKNETLILTISTLLTYLLGYILYSSSLSPLSVLPVPLPFPEKSSSSLASLASTSPSESSQTTKYNTDSPLILLPKVNPINNGYNYTFSPTTPDNIFTVVQISDLHISRFDSTGGLAHFHSFLVNELPLIAPDLVIVSGDLIDAKTPSKLASQQYLDEWGEFFL